MTGKNLGGKLEVICKEKEVFCRKNLIESLGAKMNSLGIR